MFKVNLSKSVLLTFGKSHDFIFKLLDPLSTYPLLQKILNEFPIVPSNALHPMEL